MKVHNSPVSEEKLDLLILMLEAGASQDEIAEALQVSQATVSRWTKKYVVVSYDRRLIPDEFAAYLEGINQK